MNFKKNNIFTFMSPQTSLEIIKKIPDSAGDLESLLRPIHEPLEKVRGRINQGQDVYIPYLQKIIDDQPKDINFQEELDRFVAELRPSDQQCRALSMSLILVASLEIKNVAMVASEIFQKYDYKSGWTLQRIREMSPDCAHTNWADGIYAASNYVRHSDEWRLLPITKTKEGKRMPLEAFDRIKEEFSPREQGAIISNLNIIQKLGINPERIVFEHKEVSYSLVEILGLNKPEQVAEKFRVWGERIYDRAQILIK